MGKLLVFAAAAMLVAGCGKARREPVYENPAHQFRFTPPAGWSERLRDADSPANPAQDRLLVQYKRLTAGRPAWLRVTVAELPATTTLPTCLAGRSLGLGWRREGPVEALEIGGQAAARQTFSGRWQGLDYLVESVAVRQGGRIYFFVSQFPAADGPAREQVRLAVATASWQGGAAVARR